MSSVLLDSSAIRAPADASRPAPGMNAKETDGDAASFDDVLRDAATPTKPAPTDATANPTPSDAGAKVAPERAPKNTKPAPEPAAQAVPETPAEAAATTVVMVTSADATTTIPAAPPKEETPPSDTDDDKLLKEATALIAALQSPVAIAPVVAMPEPASAADTEAAELAVSTEVATTIPQPPVELPANQPAQAAPGPQSVQATPAAAEKKAAVPAVETVVPAVAATAVETSTAGDVPQPQVVPAAKDKPEPARGKDESPAADAQSIVQLADKLADIPVTPLTSAAFPETDAPSEKPSRRERSDTAEVSATGRSPQADATPTTPTRHDSQPTTGAATGAASDGSQSTASQQADRVRFVQRVARAFETLGDRGGSLRMRLSPPELGSLRLEISVRNGAMTAQLEAETTTARDLLLQNLPQLRERLAQQDIRIERFDVGLADRGVGGGSGQTAYQQQPPAPPRSSTPAAARSPAAATSHPATATGLGSDGQRLNIIV